ncbi:hypothetical protein TNCV_4272611 [Trichonephila clavipes]|nr:hypothetical protein TNCV_4272611 [Trichonephila clavipes]
MRQANQQFSSIHTKIGNDEQLGEMEITLSLIFVLWKKLKQGVLKVYDYSTPSIPSMAILGHLATDLVILNHGQVTMTTPELTPSLLTTTPTEDLDRFNVHHLPHTAGLQRHKARTHDMPATSPLPWPLNGLDRTVFGSYKVPMA